MKIITSGGRGSVHTAHPGAFSPPSRRLRLALAATLAGGTLPAIAQQAETAPLEQVVVLGTNRTDLSALESSSPIDVFSADDIAGLGVPNLAEALQRLAPSVNMPLGAANTFASGRYAQSAALRGMAPDQTLVLVNGKRQAPSGMVINRTVWGRGAQPVDINTIPLSAIERIEVLRDGAAAQYGSDAIAGVINIVLRNSDSGADLKYQAGYYRANDKPFGAPDPSHTVQGRAAFPLLEDGFINVSVDANRLHHPREGHPDTQTWYFPGDPREATVDHKTSIAHFPADQDRIAALVNAEVGLGDAWRAYGFANYAKIERWSLGGYTYPKDDRTVRAIYPDGYANVNYIVVDSYSTAAGLKFDGGEHLGRFDFGVNYGYYDQSNGTTNGINPSLGADSPIGGFKTDEYISQQFNTDLHWVNEVDLGFLVQPATVSAGLSYRHERYEVQAGDLVSWIYGGVPILDGPNAGRPSPFGPGLPPQDAGIYTRDVQGGYFGLEFSPAQDLQLALAGRVEHYSDFGTTSTGKFSARYEFTPSFALRASFGNGYRAPSLGQVGASQTSRVPIIGLNPESTSVQTRLLPVDNPIARALGSSDLKPEKSTNFAFGGVWQWERRASVTLDLYQIDVNDKIVLSENLSGAFVRSLLTAAGYPSVEVASFYTNAVDTRTRGVDIVGRYDLTNTGPGNLILNAAFSLSTTEVTAIAPNPQPLANSGLVVVGRQAIGLIEDAAPRGKLVLGGAYDLDRWVFNLNVKRYGTFIERHPNNPAFDQTNSPQWITDLGATYRPTDRLTFNLGINNVFDTRPDLQRQQLRVLGTSRYSDLSPEGMDGTQFYAALGVQF